MYAGSHYKSYFGLMHRGLLSRRVVRIRRYSLYSALRCFSVIRFVFGCLGLACLGLAFVFALGFVLERLDPGPLSSTSRALLLILIQAPHRSRDLKIKDPDVL